jgi:hypothetical protein
VTVEILKKNSCMEKTMKELTRDEVIAIIGGGYWCTEMVDGKVVTYWVSC